MPGMHLRALLVLTFVACGASAVNGQRVSQAADAVQTKPEDGKPEEKKPDPPPPAQDPAPKPWWERLTFYGDFRARYEGFFQDGAESRHRERFRFRLGVRTTVTEGLDFNLRIASGEAADVASTNQSLTDFLNRKPVNIDQVSVAYTPTSFKHLTLGFGKYAYPVTRTQMVWDDDVNWEGTYESLTLPTTGPVSVRVVGVQSPLNEVGAGEDAFMFGEYAQASFKTGPHTVQLSIADYAFTNPDQLAVALDQRAVIRSQNTNALRREGGRVVGFQSGFNLVDAIGQVTFQTKRPQYPITALADFVVNTKAVDGQDSGIWIVGSYGRAATPKTYSASYTFARVERDAVLSAYNYSDMGPATNVLMNLGTVSYMPRNRVNLDLIAIFTRLLDAPSGVANPWLTRLQVDARVSF